MRKLAITTMVVLGLVLSSTGVGLAAGGLSSSAVPSGSGSAGVGLDPDSDAGDAGDSGDGGADGDTGLADDGAADDAAASVQAADDDELPFTGLAAIPLVLAGAALLGGGLVLRRTVL